MLKATVEHLLKVTVKHINAIIIWYHMHDVETLGVAFSRVNCDIYEMIVWDVDVWCNDVYDDVYDVAMLMLKMMPWNAIIYMWWIGCMIC